MRSVASMSLRYFEYWLYLEYGVDFVVVCENDVLKSVFMVVMFVVK